MRHLPAAELQPLLARADVMTLGLGQVVFSDDEPPDMAYFPLTAIVSMMALMRNGDEIEYGSIGREGMLGLQVALGAQPLRGRALCQLEGEVLCLEGAALRAIGCDGRAAPELHRLLMRYAQSTLHSVRERTARWLLMTRDRAASGAFALTQEFLSRMLGVHRPGVTGAAGDLQHEGIIEYRRGFIRILDGSCATNAPGSSRRRDDAALRRCAPACGARLRAQ